MKSIRMVMVAIIAVGIMILASSMNVVAGAHYKSTGWEQSLDENASCHTNVCSWEHVDWDDYLRMDVLYSCIDRIEEIGDQKILVEFWIGERGPMELPGAEWGWCKKSVSYTGRCNVNGHLYRNIARPSEYLIPGVPWHWDIQTKVIVKYYYSGQIIDQASDTEQWGISWDIAQ